MVVVVAVVHVGQVLVFVSEHEVAMRVAVHDFDRSGLMVHVVWIDCVCVLDLLVNMAVMVV